MISSIDPQVVELLNEQIAMESQAATNYLAMAAWCATKGYDNSSDFFYRQSDEERRHMLKIFRYVCDMGAEAIAPAVNAGKANFVSLKEVFETALKAEIAVTTSINHIVSEARKVKDYPTESMMQWFVQEQVEEEYTVRRACELFELMGEDKLAIFMIDERIPKIEFVGEVSGGAKSTPAE